MEDPSEGFTIVGGGNGVSVSVGIGEGVAVCVGVRTTLVDVAGVIDVEVAGMAVDCGSNTFT